MNKFGHFVVGALVAAIVLGPPAWTGAYRAVGASLTVASSLIAGHPGHASRAASVTASLPERFGL